MLMTGAHAREEFDPKCIVTSLQDLLEQVEYVILHTFNERLIVHTYDSRKRLVEVLVSSNILIKFIVEIKKLHKHLEQFDNKI